MAVFFCYLLLPTSPCCIVPTYPLPNHYAGRKKGRKVVGQEVGGQRLLGLHVYIVCFRQLFLHKQCVYMPLWGLSVLCYHILPSLPDHSPIPKCCVLVTLVSMRKKTKAGRLFTYISWPSTCVARAYLTIPMPAIPFSALCLQHASALSLCQDSPCPTIASYSLFSPPTVSPSQFS